jgi:phosphoserine phosphatase RsbU/P
MSDGLHACDRTPVETAWDGELATAARLQRALLPASPYRRGAWSIAHQYSPAGAVGGDMVDVIPSGDRLYFLIADVSGKGMAAAMLAAYIHAVFRSLIPFGLSIEEVVRRASALLCASTLPAQYATLVFGVLEADGQIVMANAGHPPALVIGRERQAAVVSTGTAAGLFCDSTFSTTRLSLAPGDTLLLYSDGVTEAFDAADNEYGLERLQETAAAATLDEPQTMLARIAADQGRFVDGAPPADDLTMVAIRRDPSDELTIPTPGCHDTTL